jgi:hypothetical protein
MVTENSIFQPLPKKYVDLGGNFSKFVRFKKEYYKRLRRNTQIFTPLKSVKKCRRNPRILANSFYSLCHTGGRLVHGRV